MVIPINRRSYLGSMLLKCLCEDQRRVSITNDSGIYLAVSNFAGNNDREILRGDRNFLKLESEASKKIISKIEADFDTAFYNFIKGAEFAHKKNGWKPSQKRKGIRKHAIIDFCKKYRVNTRKKTIETLFKKYQRHIARPKPVQTKGLEKFGQELSF